MDAMYSAIKNRRGGLLSDEEENAHQMPEEKSSSGGMDMKSLVGALSPEQKNQLLTLLVSDESKGPQAKGADDIAKGGMGPGEEAEIQESLGDGHESEDDIAEGMISSSDKMRASQGDKPRNLGERMKFELAKKKLK